MTKTENIVVNQDDKKIVPDATTPQDALIEPNQGLELQTTEAENAQTQAQAPESEEQITLEADTTPTAEELNAVEPAADDTPAQNPDADTQGRFQDAEAVMVQEMSLMEGRDMMHAESLTDTNIARPASLNIEDDTSSVMMMMLTNKQDATTINITEPREYEFRDITGANNNLDNPNWGQASQNFLSIAGLEYGDGISTPNDAGRPNVRDVSNAIFAQNGDLFSSAGTSNFMWVWGQFIDHDITLTRGESGEAYNITIPQGDRFFDPFNTGQAEMHFERSAAAEGTGAGTGIARENVNDITSFIDASNVYGSDEDTQNALRAEGGKMLTSGDNLLPLINGDHGPEFHAGDVRANENVGLTGMHTIFMREHNRIVDLLQEQNPEMSDEQLYQTAKMVVEAQIQKVTFDEFLTRLLGDDAIADYQGYDSTIDPRMATEFATTAFRVGHTMLSSDIFRMQEDGSESEFGHLTLQQAFFRPDLIMRQGGIDEALRGLAASGSQEIDAHIIDDVRNFLFGPPGAGGFDLVSLNIQRGRDHGMQDFNSVREAYGLDPIEDFFALTADADLAQRLTDLYGDISNLDLWVGGLIEAPHEDGLVGETFHIMIAEQFTRLRDGDRFWYEGRLEDDLLDLVEGSSLSDIIARNSDIDFLQNDIFSTFNRIGGDDQDNIIEGTDTSDLIIGFDGNDVLNGGAGIDELYGGNGADLFVFSANDLTDGVDLIGDFNGLDGDRLNLGDILADFDPNQDLISDFVQTENVDGGVMIQVTDANTQTQTNLVFIENIQNFDLNWIETGAALV